MLALLDICHATASARGRLCACLEPHSLGRLRAVAGDARLVAGEVLFGQGAPADAVYGLRQGAVMLATRMPDGRRQVLSFLFPGDTFGFSADDRHGCSAIALRRSSFCRIPLSALEEDGELAVRMHAIAQARMADTFEHMVRLGRMTAGERVSDFLFWLWRRLDQPAEMALPMRLLDIADHLGLRLETVSRRMAALRRAGILGPLSTDGVLPVLDGPALRQR